MCPKTARTCCPPRAATTATMQQPTTQQYPMAAAAELTAVRISAAAVADALEQGIARERLKEKGLWPDAPLAPKAKPVRATRAPTRDVALRRHCAFLAPSLVAGGTRTATTTGLELRLPAPRRKKKEERPESPRRFAPPRPPKPIARLPDGVVLSRDVGLDHSRLRAAWAVHARRGPWERVAPARRRRGDRTSPSRFIARASG